MRSRVFVLVVLVISSAGHAGTESGAEVALHGSFSLPLGDIVAQTSFSDALTGFVPVGAELGFRFNRNVYAGLFGSYGWGITKNCPTGLDCAAHAIAIGIEGRYRLPTS